MSQDDTRDIYHIRRRNLQQLASHYRTRAAFAAVIGLEPSHLSQLIGKNPTRNIGNVLANKIEAATGKPPQWLDQDQTGTSNVEEGPKLQRELPEITWTLAGRWSLIKEDEGVHAHAHAMKRFAVTKEVGKRAFVLRVKGDSMEPKFPEGACIVVDPDHPAEDGKAVVATVGDGSEALLRQLVIEGGQTYLKATNPRYPIINVTGQDFRVCGVVRQVILDLD